MWCMSKSEVYSWRISPELKADIEAAARAEKATISTLLERIVREWLGGGGRVHDEDGSNGSTRRRLSALGNSTAGILFFPSRPPRA